MTLVNATSVITADIVAVMDSITVDATAINSNTHFIVLHLECIDTDGLKHFIDPKRFPLTWRYHDDEWAQRFSRHMHLLPAAFHVPVNDADLHPVGEVIGLRDIIGNTDPDFHLQSAKCTFLCFA